MKNIKTTFDENFSLMKFNSVLIKKIIKILGVVREKHSLYFYFVGGITRDAILKRDTTDIDLSVNIITQEFLDELENIFGEKFVFHENFKTANLEFQNLASINIATFRKESYENFGVLPKVETCPENSTQDIIDNFIEADILRRDFSVNTFAFGKNKNLIYYFSAKKDLAKRKIRILHNKSFLDDPTRILRGIKFALRLNFDFEKNTEKFLLEALEEEPNIFGLISEERFSNEFDSLYREKNFYKLFFDKKYKYILEKLFGFKTLRRDFFIENFFEKEEKYKNSKKKILKNKKENIKNRNLKEKIFIYLMQNNYLENYSEQNISQNYFYNKFLNLKKENIKNLEEIFLFLSRAEKNSEIYFILEKMSDEKILLLKYFAKKSVNISVTQKIFKFERKLKKIIQKISGKDLIDNNFTPSENFKILLQKSFELQLDNPKFSKKEILNILLSL
ncbi:MAG: hypothetical protein ACRCSK_06900 [Fusobacteriaceae bacterium]